jgi:hypothetical protein
MKAIGGDAVGNPAEVRMRGILNPNNRQRSCLMMVRNTCWEKATTSRIWKRPSITSTKLASRIQVRIPYVNISLDMAAAHHYRGRCYQGMGDF